MRVAILIPLLMGCGGPLITQGDATSSVCLQYYVKGNIGSLDYDKVVRNEANLRSIFTFPWSDGGGISHMPLFTDVVEFCNTFHNVAVDYDWTYSFPCSFPGSKPDQRCWGQEEDFLGEANIHLEFSGNSFAHELIHFYESEHGIFFNVKHIGWAEKGYFYLNDVIWRGVLEPPMIGPKGEANP